MKFYEVWVSSMAFHGNDPLTYSCETPLPIGAVVQVPLQRKLVVGVVRTEVAKPSFQTKPITLIPEPATIPSELLQLLEWLRTYYPAPSGQIASLFLPTNIVQKGRSTSAVRQEPKKKIPLPPLTSEQTAALKKINANDNKPVLLHGDTGSGKTRVYTELARDRLANGRSVMILTPEIGLTPQLLKTFSDEFPGKTVVVHSHLTPAERRKTWLTIANSTEPLIVIGPRSALFTPIKQLGLVVVDEAHDNAYKQEQSPHYQATRVAAQLSKLHDAKLVMGTATPNIVDYYMFQEKKLPIVRMSAQAVSGGKNEAAITVVNIRDRSHFTKSSWLSNELLDATSATLNSGNQSLIFLNRRGTARVVVCQVCDWQAVCPKCDVPLTYHGDSHLLRCHTCGHRQKSPSDCPTCHATEILYKSVGTKAITDELSRIFPNARIARFDSDNNKADRIDQNHDLLQAGTIDILVGTQLLTKGLDLPKLAFVGVVTADTALFFPDYTAEEITFQQLSQVIGRVGRGHTAGSVIIQTYYPENPALKAIEDKNYSLFYEQQIIERERFLFPPFSYVLKLNCSRKSSESAQKACENLHTFIASLPLKIEIIGPAPRFMEKQSDSYHWQLTIKAKKRTVLTSIINQLPAQIQYDIDPSNLL